MNKNIVKKYKKEPESLYFVDSIFKPLESNASIVSMLPTENEAEQSTRVLSLNSEQLNMTNHSGTIREGWYVFYNEKDDQQRFSYGNLSPYARQQFRAFNALQQQLIENSIDPEREEDTILLKRLEKSNNLDVFSYHVNVGHGNCSIILIQDGLFYQIWMVDCSIIDKSNWHNYSANLESCFEAIKLKLNKRHDESIRINRFFLTHTHYDHYNGLEYLVDNHYIDEGTVCYVNLYYHCANKTYIRILDKLKQVGVKFVEPINKNSHAAVRFLHPECRLYRSKATIVNAPSNYRIVNDPLNNSSIVIMITLGGQSIVFPGDLEQNGFDRMTQSGTCSPFLFKSDYYVVSHHGSINGHPDRPCLNIPMPEPTPLFCVRNGLKNAILMGRDGAYNGIYSPHVVRFFSNLGSLICTEKAPHFVELEWRTGHVQCL